MSSKEKEEVIKLLNNQLEVEKELKKFYEEAEGEAKSTPIKHILHMHQLDSMNHIDICLTVIEVLLGEDILTPEKKELYEILRNHIDLEKDSLKRIEKIMSNEWINKNQGLNELMKMLREDDKRHHQALIKLSDENFFAVFDNISTIFKSPEELEERYIKYERHKDEKADIGKS